jgi:hypothetical protein
MLVFPLFDTIYPVAGSKQDIIRKKSDAKHIGNYGC